MFRCGGSRLIGNDHCQNTKNSRTVRVYTAVSLLDSVYIPNDFTTDLFTICQLEFYTNTNI